MGVRTAQNMLRQRQNNVYAGGDYYVEGNTVKVAGPKAVPGPKPYSQGQERVYREKPRKRLSYEEQKQNAARVRQAAKTVTVSVNRSLTVLLAIAVAVVMYMGYDYLCLKSSIDTHMDNIKTLETRLENLKNENDALEGSIDTSIDLNHIYQVAVDELGMVPGDQSNIIQYEKTESEYVRQYEDIPSAE